MSFKLVGEQLAAFLSTDMPEVLCVRGSWGVGKTYAWRAAFDAALSSNTLGLQRYSYVSLFGINSLEGLRAASFENLQFASDGKKENLLDMAIGATNQVLTKGSKFLGSILQTAADAANVGALGATANAVMFASVRSQIICIDDLERVGEGLRVKDVLGYISFMKEERSCKVVLLLNDRQLEEASEVDFQRNFEKVVDRSVVLSPQPAEAVEIALGGVDSVLAQRLIGLGVTNIRIAKKIRASLDLCSDVLSSFDSEVAEQAAVSMALLGWSRFRGEGAPTLEFINGLADRRRDDIVRSYGSNKDTPKAVASEEETRWLSILEQYPFSHVDEFDRSIIRVLERGYCDPADLALSAAVKQDETRALRGQTDLQAAWDKFHESFDDDTAKLVQEFETTTRRHITSMPTSSLFQVVQLFADVGEHGRASALVEAFYTANAKQGSVPYDEGSFRRYVRDEKLANQISRTFDGQQSVVAASLTSLLNRLDVGSWNDEHLEELRRFDVADFVTAFKSLRGKELSNAGRACLQWRNVTNPTDAMTEVQSKVIEALTQIGATSKLNAARLAKFGIRVE